VTIHKLTSTDAFVAFDLDGAPSAGIVRSAPKILQGGAKDLARSLTYAFATLEMQRGGASAGINAQPDDQGDAVAAFAAELTPMVADGTLAVDPGKGVDAVQLAELTAVDNRSELMSASRDYDSLPLHLAGLGPVLAAEAVLGGLEGKTIAVEGFADNGPALVAEAIARGASVSAIATAKGLLGGGHDAAAIREMWTVSGAAMVGDDADAAWKIFATEADVLFCGSKMGAINHDTAAKLNVGAVVPHSPLPYTARALAVMQRADITVVPDFVPTAAPLLVGWPSAQATSDSIVSAVADLISAALGEAGRHEDGLFLGACHRAEAFLGTWRDALPFGRPLAG
jgi:glutamate dehydrogenase (NAD(P)+)